MTSFDMLPPVFVVLIGGIGAPFRNPPLKLQHAISQLRAGLHRTLG